VYMYMYRERISSPSRTPRYPKTNKEQSREENRLLRNITA
jgi:hypothetical protein